MAVAGDRKPYDKGAGLRTPTLGNGLSSLLLRSAAEIVGAWKSQINCGNCYGCRRRWKNEVNFKRQERGYTAKDETDSKHI